MKVLDQMEKQYLDELFVSPKQIYLSGIGGVGMSALAKVLVHLGHRVSGSDAKPSTYLNSLIEKGVKITFNQLDPNLEGVDFLVYSSAIRETHPEMIAAKRLRIPAFHRAHILSVILNRYSSIAVTGTHGKTTTSGMISYLLKELGANPTCLVGSKMKNIGDNVILGDRKIFVAEVDESDGTQENYSPTHAVMTNLDNDHMDYYQTLDHLVKSFKELAGRTQKDGWVVYSHEDSYLKKIMKETDRNKISYGFTSEADFHAESIIQENFHIQYRFYKKEKFLTEVHLSVPGMHNVLNSMAALSLLNQLGYDLEKMTSILERFQGTSRRLDIKFDSDQMIVIDDYAHHPTEVQASLSALKKLGKKICVVFQPHRFTRTRYLAEAFGSAFQFADSLIVTDIYSAGETASSNEDSVIVVDQVKASKHPDVQLMGRDKIVDYLISRFNSFDLVAFMGAGDIGELADDFVGRIKNRA